MRSIYYVPNTHAKFPPSGYATLFTVENIHTLQYNPGVATYPDNWEHLAKACKDRAGWACEECDATERLTAAHINHDPENPTPELRCLCWPCHRSYDIRTGANYPGKQARRLATRRRNLARRRVEQSRVRRVRMRYLTTLWLMSCLPYLYKRFALEHELATIHIVGGRMVRYMPGSPRK